MWMKRNNNNISKNHSFGDGIFKMISIINITIIKTLYTTSCGLAIFLCCFADLETF